MIADIKTGEKGSLYTDSILTIPSQYLTEEYIGKISSQVVTVAIDNKTGKMYYGLSNPLNNPTNNATTHKVLKELIDNAGTPPIAYRGNGFYNYGEFNAINNALTNSSNIENLFVYSIRINDYLYYPPCKNCSLLYRDICIKLYNKGVNFINE